MTATLAWHFVGDTLLGGRPVPADGVPLTHEGKLVPCRSGLHACPRILDALTYAPGGTLCRVECAGRIVEHENDKIVASERTILWRIDAAPVLRRFARECALDIAHLWKAPAFVLAYLRTGDEALRSAAEDTAMAAGWGNARGVAGAGAEDAAWAAADCTAWDAALAAAKDAARTAAGGADCFTAWAAARAAQEARLVALAEAAHAAKDT